MFNCSVFLFNFIMSNQDGDSNLSSIIVIVLQTVFSLKVVFRTRRGLAHLPTTATSMKRSGIRNMNFFVPSKPPTLLQTLPQMLQTLFYDIRQIEFWRVVCTELTFSCLAGKTRRWWNLSWLRKPTLLKHGLPHWLQVSSVTCSVMFFFWRTRLSLVCSRLPFSKWPVASKISFLQVNLFCAWIFHDLEFMSHFLKFCFKYSLNLFLGLWVNLLPSANCP